MPGLAGPLSPMAKQPQFDAFSEKWGGCRMLRVERNTKVELYQDLFLSPCMKEQFQFGTIV